MLLAIFFGCGLILVFLKHLRDLKHRKSVDPLQIPDDAFTVKRIAFTNGLFEYGITVCATLFSFYAGYLLGKHKTDVDTKNNAISLLKSSETKLDIFEGYLKAFHDLYSTADIPNKTRDSAAMTTYYHNYEKKPYYILEHVPTDQMLTLLDTSAYFVISELEENEKSALRTIKNLSLPFSYRKKTLDGALSFDVLRKNAIIGERLLLTRQITRAQYDSLYPWLEDSTYRLILSLNSK
jgi:hypothetical protein